jgi:hypothetical protein
MPPGVKISNDGRHFPVAVAIDHIAAVSMPEQLRIEPVVVGPWLGVGSQSGGARRLGQLLIIQETHSLRRYRLPT